jgi:hypothetical protein
MNALHGRPIDRPPPSPLRLALVAAGLGLLSVLSAPRAVESAAASPPVATSPAERWILERMAAGEVADLATFSRDADRRRLGARFLEQLLTTPPEATGVHWRGIRLLHGIVEEPLELRSATIHHEVWLDAFEFREAVSFSFSRFARSLSIERSAFTRLQLDAAVIDGTLFMQNARFSGDANFKFARIGGALEAGGTRFHGRAAFHGLTVDRAFFREATFEGPAEFGHVTVATTLSCSQSQFTSKDKTDFNGATIGRSLFLTRATFSGPVDIAHTRVAKNLELNDAAFLDSQTALSLNAAWVGGSVVLEEARFGGRVNASAVSVERNLYLRKAIQLSATSDLNLGSAKIKGSALLDGMEFRGGLVLRGAQIGESISLDGARFDSRERPVNLHNITVGDSVFIRRVQAEGPLSLSYARMRHLEVVDSEFRNAERGVTFETIKVEGPVFLTRTRFHGPVSLTNADIAGTLNARGVQFLGADGAAGFTAMKIGGDVQLREAIFAGRADLSRSVTGMNLDLQEARFARADVAVGLAAVRVEGALLLRKADAAGSVDATLARVGLDLDARGARFGTGGGELYNATTLNLRGARIGGSALFEGTSFGGSAILKQAQIVGDLDLQGSSFSSETEPADLSGVNVGGTTILSGCRFACPVSVADGIFLDLVVAGAGATRVAIGRLDLSRASVRRKLEFRDAVVGDFIGPGLRVEGLATIRNTRLVGNADLQYAHFAGLTVEAVEWPTGLNAVLLRGMKYSMIEAGGGRESAAELVRLLSRAEYTSDAYAGLAQYLSQHGQEDTAEAVFVAQKRRERAAMGEGRWGRQLTSFDWWRSLFLDGLIGYGRRPELAFLWSTAFVGVGCWVFRRRDGMETVKPEEAGRSYSGAWYSLDLFLPVVDLGVASTWRPREGRRLAATYARVHALLGWLLIPIGLAALTGLIKS